MKLTQFEVKKGLKNNIPWYRLDVYFEAIDGLPYKVSSFLDSRTMRILGITDADCNKPFSFMQDVQSK